MQENKKTFRQLREYEDVKPCCICGNFYHDEKEVVEKNDTSLLCNNWNVYSLFWWNDEQITDNSLVMFCALSTLITRIWMSLLSQTHFFRSSICSTSLDSSTTFPFTMVWVTTLTIFLVLTSGSSTKGRGEKNNAKTKRHENVCKFSVLNLYYWTTQVVFLDHIP